MTEGDGKENAWTRHSATGPRGGTTKILVAAIAFGKREKAFKRARKRSAFSAKTKHLEKKNVVSGDCNCKGGNTAG